MIEVLKIEDEKSELEITPGLLSATIGIMSDYTKQIKDCDCCKLNKVCKKGFNTCPKSWKKELIE